jgi:hypothetical protein
MLFVVPNSYKVNPELLRARVLINAYSVIQNYPMRGAETVLNGFVQQQYGKSLKDLCLDLLLHVKFQVDDEGNVILVFNDKKYDTIAQLITFGNGAIQGSRILQTAFFH